MSKPAPVFQTTNWSSDNQPLKRRGSLMVWFDPEMSWSQPRAASPVILDDFRYRHPFCLLLKVLFRLPIRQTTGFVVSLLVLSRLDRAFLDYTTLCRRQKDWKVQIPYRATSVPLLLLVDSSGTKFSGKGDWRPAHTAPAAAGSGARFTSVLMLKPWKRERWT